VSPLLLHCDLCGRKQAAGILSRAAWGNVVFTDGTDVSACPDCQQQHPDWEERLRRGEGGAPPSYGGGYGGSSPEA
jgi:hypothetical protein